MGVTADWDLDHVCGLIEEGVSIMEIARQHGRVHSSLCEWLSHPDRTARASAAKHRSAEGWMDRGLAELINIPDDGTQAQISRAKEIAQHCRKMAAIRNPRQYSDRMEVSHSGNLNVLTMTDEELLRIVQEQTGQPMLIEYKDVTPKL